MSQLNGGETSIVFEISVDPKKKPNFLLKEKHCTVLVRSANLITFYCNGQNGEILELGESSVGVGSIMQ